MTVHIKIDAETLRTLIEAARFTQGHAADEAGYFIRENESGIAAKWSEKHRRWREAIKRAEDLK